MSTEPLPWPLSQERRAEIERYFLRPYGNRRQSHEAAMVRDLFAEIDRLAS